MRILVVGVVLSFGKYLKPVVPKMVFDRIIDHYSRLNAGSGIPFLPSRMKRLALRSEPSVKDRTPSTRRTTTFRRFSITQTAMAVAREWLVLSSAIVFALTGLPLYFLPIAVGLVYLASKYGRTAYIGVVTLPRDLRFVSRYARVMYAARKFAKSNVCVSSIFDATVAKHPDKTCFFFEDQEWSYKRLQELSWRIANVLNEAGLKKGQVIAIVMGNRPEFVATWLGASRLGLVSALVNVNLQRRPLEHSFQAVAPAAVILTTSLAPGVIEVRDCLAKSTLIYDLDADEPHEGILPLAKLLKDAAATPPPVDPPGYKDKLIYIFTSGTTGLPKAAIIPNSRYLLATLGTQVMLQLQPSDRIYNPLPLYHLAGGILGVGPALAFGVSSVIRPKFSASNYWTDCIRYKCTIGQYIGEICRYVLAVPPKPTDTSHSVRLMVGNGMRTAIWEPFVERFKIPEIRELYGATEGNVNIINIDDTVGTVGAIPSLMGLAPKMAGLIKVDQTGVPIRDANGLCIACKTGEPGMFVGLITSLSPAAAFHGYADAEASNKKILKDVFKRGDRAFNSGDVLVQDEYGYMYFKDRTGDTFRWRGENVATAEVEAVISNLVEYRDTAVYGVEVPGQEGRAGMAAILDDAGTLDLPALATALDGALPGYARPLFLRKVPQMELTGTFKLKKIDLQKQGFDPATINDDLFFRKGRTFVELTDKLYEEILSGRERL